MLDVNFDFTSDTPDYWNGYWERNDDPDFSKKASPGTTDEYFIFMHGQRKVTSV